MDDLLKKLKDAESVTAFVDALWDADPDNPELEKLYDQAKAREHRALIDLAEVVSSATGLKLTQVLNLIKIRREKIEEILKNL